MTTFEYVTSPGNSTVHAAKEPVLLGGRTACGRKLTKKWELGDETVSGIAATCDRCKEAVRKANANATK